MSNVFPFSLRLRTQDTPHEQSRPLGTLRVSRDGRVRAESLDSELQPYLSAMAEKLSRRVMTVEMVGPDAAGRFDSWNRVVEHDDPEYAEALMLSVEGEYGLIVEQAA
jgi:hypothetical protein